MITMDCRACGELADCNADGLCDDCEIEARNDDPETYEDEYDHMGYV